MVALLVTDKVSETEVRSIRWFKEKYQPALTRAVARPMPFILGGAGVFAAAVLLFGTLGQEFMPQLDEKDITVTNFRIPSASDRKSTRLNPVTNAHLVCRLLLEKKKNKHTKDS